MVPVKLTVEACVSFILFYNLTDSKSFYKNFQAERDLSEFSIANSYICTVRSFYSV